MPTGPTKTSWKSGGPAEHSFGDEGARVQTILAFAEGTVNLLVSTFVILSIVCFRRNFNKQIKLYTNMVVACFCAGLYQVTSRAVTLVFHYKTHPDDGFAWSTESELIKFSPCVAILYSWILTRDIIFLTTVPITLDRILAVGKPIYYKRYSTNRFFSGAISITWLVAFLHVGAIALIALLLSENNIFLSQHTLQCTFRHHDFSAWVTLSIYLGLGLPTLVFHVLGYTLMFLKMRGRVKLAESSYKLLKIGVMVAVTFSITWLPQVIVKIINHAQAERNEKVHTRLPNSVEFICFILSNSSPVLNCIIYIFAVKNIRKIIVDGYSQRISTVKRRVSQSALVKSASNIRMRNFQSNRSYTSTDYEVPNIRQKVLEINTVGDKERVPLCSDHENESAFSRSTRSRDEQSDSIEEPELSHESSGQSSICHDD